MTRASLLTVSALIVLLSAGCGKKDVHTTVSAGPGGSVQYTAKGANGETAQITAGGGGQVKLPSYLPLYPGAVVESSMVASGGVNTGNLVMFHTASKPADVVAFYKQKAAGAGFGSTFSSQSGDNTMFTAAKEGAEEGLQVAATPADGGASVQLTWTQGKKG